VPKISGNIYCYGDGRIYAGLINVQSMEKQKAAVTY